MKKTLEKILYKQYLAFISAFIWLGISLIFGIDSDMFCGFMFVILGIGLLFSEKEFIKVCDKQGGK